MSDALVLLTLLVTIGIYAIYWTAWKIRNDLIEGRQKLNSELDQMKKLLEGKTGGA